MPNRDAALEAFRRRQGQVPSTAGISGGAPATNAVTSQNPLATFAMNNLPATQTPPPTSMSQPGVDQLKNSMTGEANLILKALIDRLKKNPVGGGAPAVV